MRASQFRFLLWRLIALSDTGKYDGVTVAEVSRHAQARGLSSFLLERLGEASGVGTLDETDRAALDAEWGGMANGPEFDAEVRCFQSWASLTDGVRSAVL